MRTIIILLIAFPFCAWSQPGMSIDQTLEQALKNNAGIKASQYEVEAANAFRKTGTDIGKTSVLGMFGQYNSYAEDNNFLVSQTIPFTAFGSQSSLNRSLAASSVLKKAASENELRYQVKQVYYQLLFTKARQRLLLQQDSIYEGFLKAASARYKSGEAKLLEQATAEVQRNEIKNQLRQNDAKSIGLRTQLMTLLNSDALPEIADEEFKQIQFEELPDTASASANPGLAYMRQQVEVAQRQKRVESAKFAPDLLLGYFNQTLIRTPDPETGNFSTASTRFQGFQIGVAIPLWFVPQQGRVKAAEFSRQASQSNYRNYQIGVRGQIQQAIQQYQISKSSLNYYQSSALPNADLIIKQSQAAFRGGEINYAEYLLGVRSAIGIKDSYLQTLSDYNQSIIYIEFLTGIK